ncbi:MAG TPA: SxtJ family membrane protein [Candidatus Hydrogenedentes bacterium]|jgi:hypothetical protein|nr:MAG: hypothetical protein BWY07_01289 [Candidatus Hydrogenedentes bacterium ADurb.Bin170]HNZ47614.1 SxtJ family membrane protein [Candidatus Hydrogenedentota bacterium]HOD94358.1 SxtJ family membrane protein [Candidatus Hydrogenedentota bacterium]HOR49797.1 SxtJ family membrane protein [Candidatus Hydrogenedentota bacterium]HPK23762.1 SxtJ family membrane protein [Candidatus Hydrogenedentota bacterium]
MLDIDTSDRKEQRKFGFVMAAAIVILGGIRFALHGFTAIPWAFLAVAVLFAVPAALFPGALRPVFVVWIKFALVLNWIVTHVMLTLVYYLIIVPMGLIMRVAGKDPLNRKWLPATESYWEEPEEQPEEFERYHHQF